MELHMDRTVEVAATPERIWPLVSDLRRTATLMDTRATVVMDGPERPIGKHAVFQHKTGSGLKSTWKVTAWAPPCELAYHVDLGVFDGGTTSVTIEATPTGSRVRLRVPLIPWPQTWAIVRWMTRPLVRMEARRQGDRWERMLRAQLG